MKRNIAYAVAIVAALGAGSTFADDITVDTTPFVSTKNRAEVQRELMNRPQLMRADKAALAMQGSPRRASAYTREQARAEYVAAQDEVNALNGEDSGSAYLASTAGRANARAIMGGPAR